MDYCNYLVSVIVPVYNVEKYLNRCIESIIKQTYKKLEIILIDDGSTDDSGKICDEYVLKDSRIKVIHKKNGGLSSARNCGIEVAKGDYLTFVDSDDWIKIDFIENLTKYLNNYEYDIVSSRLVVTFENENGYVYVQPFRFSDRILTSEEALEGIFYRKIITSTACAKLFKRALFNNIRFPENKIHEDLAIIYKTIDYSNKIVASESTGYFYYQRFGSIMNSDFKAGDLDNIEFVEEIIEFVKEKHLDLKKAAYTLYVDILLDSYFKLLKTKKKQFYYLKKKLNREILLKSRYVLLNINSRNKLKIKLLLFLCGEYIIKIYLILITMKEFLGKIKKV